MDKNILNGFEIFEDFLPGPKKNEETIEDFASEELTDEELKNIKDDKDNKEEDTTEDVNNNKNKESLDTSEKQTEATKTDDTQDKSDINNNDNNSNDDENAFSAFFDIMADKLGWELTEDETKPQTPEELVDYFQQVIEENSVPQYASKEVEDLDNFIRNGGNLKDYLSIDAELDLDNINIEDDENLQKTVLKQFMKEKGFSNEQITKKLNKYEDAGLLEDEAEDALEALKTIKEQKKQQLLDDQQKQAERAKKRQQEYFNRVVEEIKNMDNVRGIKIPEKDKRILLEYIFKPDANGLTKFQKDWSKSVRNLLESAYFTMKGDALLSAAKIEGSNKAIDKFKNSLNNSNSKKTKKQETTDSVSMWDSFARQIRKF